MANQNSMNRAKRFAVGSAVVGTLLMVPLSPIPLFTGTAPRNNYVYLTALAVWFAVPLFCDAVVYLFAWIFEGFSRAERELARHDAQRAR